MNQNKLICVDIETTDLFPETGQIVSGTFTVLDKTSGNVLDSLRVKFGYRGDVIPSADAVFVNGINVFSQKGQSEAETAETIHKYLSAHGGSESPFLGHNIDSDIKHIKSLFRRNGFDPRVVSYKKVDTYVEGAKAIAKDKLSVDKLEEVTSSDGKQRRSLKQSSLAKALNIEIDESRLHDDAYDVEINRKIWLKLGKPTEDDKLEINNPYELEQSYRGKVITSLEWDSFNCKPVSKSYYVTGAGSETMLSGKKEKTHSTVLLRTDGEGFAICLSLHKAHRENPEDEKLRKAFLSSLSKIAVERKFTSHEWFSVEIKELTEGEAVINAISQNAIALIENERIEKREKEYENLLKEASKVNFTLQNPENRLGAVKFDSFQLIRNTAEKIADMSREERIAYISNLANTLETKRGIVWADTMLKLSIEFGIRNRIDGFDSDRISSLKKTMPEHVDVLTLSRDISEVENVVVKAMERSGFVKLDFICNGKDVKLKAFDSVGAEAARRKIDIQNKENGALLFPLAPDIATELSTMLGISQSAANKLRTGFSAFVDDRSYSAVKDYYKRVIEKALAEGKKAEANALEETLEYLGDSYEDFLEKAKPNFEKKTGLSAFDVLKNKISNKNNEFLNEQSKKLITAEEIIDKYEALGGIAVPPEADSLMIMALNLKNPHTAALKELDHIVLKKGIYLCLPGEEGELGLEPGEVDEEDKHGIRCKVCNRLFNSRNAVAGMGPTCAKKLLEEWLNSPETGESELSNQIYQRLSEIKTDGGYPIMLVRDTNSGKTFATDIKARDKDGRYLVVDLSGVMKKGGQAGIASLFRETLKVYLDEENYEVIKIFGNKKS